MFVEVELEDVIDTPLSEAPFLVLKEKKGNRCCTIRVGFMEAHNIVNQFEGVHAPRPMTHDLILDMLEKAGAHMKAVQIVKEKAHTYYAIVQIESNSGTIERVDARPSDAITLALKKNCPIYLKEDLFARHLDRQNASEFEQIISPLLLKVTSHPGRKHR
ncbi:MAG: bifunctional nuclease family protein [Acidobacteria bacterium]|nr:MAG: bifunctional nuclease family protein [Acidobacteriota bacterium]